MEYRGKYGYPAVADRDARRLSVNDFDAVVIPGGFAPDYLRRNVSLVKFVRQMFQAGKVVAAICHGGWLLVSAGVLPGRRVTSFFAIRDDLKNAGAHWFDREVIRDGNLITSRQPEDLPAFVKTIIEALS
jgi:protease I